MSSLTSLIKDGFKIEGCGKCGGIGCVTKYKFEGRKICANCIDKMLGSGNYDLDKENLEVVKILRRKIYHE